MPDQFAVHVNQARSRDIPYLLVVQSNQFRAAPRSVVVPLIAAAALNMPASEIGPQFLIEGAVVTLDPLQITNLPNHVLGKAVASLVDQSDRIVNALDLMLTSAWR